ncbi:GTPase inhibitor [Imleria badia]|nr:GTPase inhibitor [Imleria badia]
MDTEFDDALRKHGILPPREPSPKTPSPPPSPTLHEALADLTPDELRELGEDVTDDDFHRTVDAFRRQRLAGERSAVNRPRFGRVYPIGREDYTREVTEASKISEEDDKDEKGTGLICFLHKDGIPRSDRTFNHVRDLAARYPRTKFVSIVGNKCIADLPDTRIPMLIVYRKGEIKNQLVAWGADRERRLEELEAILMLCGAIDPPEHPVRSDRTDSSDEDDDDDDDDDDPSSHMRSAATRTNAQAAKNIRGPPRKDDSDSEFEFDM